MQPSTIDRPAPMVSVTTRDRWSAVALMSLVAAAFLYCYWDVFRIMVWQWSTNDVYSHGFLIPVISGYLAWQRRERLFRTIGGSSPVVGSLILIAGLALLLLGRRVDITAIQQLSLLPTVAGLVCLFGGARALRILWLPIAYLLFMMPIWDVFTERLHMPFQQFSATLGAWMLGLIGVPVFHQDTYLQLPNVTLEVARVCSGVNYLIAVVAIGVPVAYVAFHDTVRRVLLVAFAVMIAILGNSIRVTLIGVLAYHNVSENIHGPGHVLQGLFVAAMGYGALLAGVRLLARLWPRSDVRPAPAPAMVSMPTSVRPATYATAVHAAVLMVVAGSLSVSATGTGTPAAAEKIELPTVIGDWAVVSGFQPVVGSKNSELSPTATWRAYRRPDGSTVEVFLGAVAESDVKGADAYWRTLLSLSSDTHSLNLGSRGQVTVNRGVRTSAATRDPILFWYDIGGRTSNDPLFARLATVWSRLTGTARAPVLVVVASASAGKADGAETVSSFAGQLIQVLGEDGAPE